ncbi:MAG: hypothetical protein L0Y71_08795 [Gemmataceae bacterium]|nr:hypothetical protein [Gemmataceae bacterium]
MLRTGTMIVATLALAGWTMSSSTMSSARAQDDELRALVAKATKAHGGKELLKKYQGAQVKYKGKVDSMGVMADVEGEIYVYPERMKNTIAVEVNGMNIKIQQGFDGKALWIDVMGMSQVIDDADKIKDMKENMYAEQVGNLVDLDNKEYRLGALGEMKIKDKDAVGIRVSKEGKRDVNLWFDKKTHLLVKHEFRGKDPFGQQGEVNNEKYFTGYKDVMGVQTPAHMEVHNDGKKIVELEITETRYHEKLDDSTFAKP